MKNALNIASALISLFIGTVSSAQDSGYDVFVPITKYLQAGDADKLSAWFADNLEVTIFTVTNDSSRSQARQILKTFFNSYTPRSFDITHKAGRANMKYALGSLNAGGEIFVVTIFVSYKDTSYKIQQLKIERIQ
ncbi:MAG: DUF4783 domain-containing protein [Bacteroidetes bacterium]|uniref:DUF4783 domain-containing protein n=1 Tax=Candidatus Cryptobacteroides faecipullorum TaxID=2840764 RepID=A0A9D9I978_9BACT|nr:DUF4783 domain-containing protein [Candidatus Cryptobacteroides faecipullorum]